MGFHHVALATTDLAATHAFYTEAMGFELVKAVVAPTDDPAGWAKHVFYDTASAPEPVFHRGRRPSADAPAPAAGG
jgi:catechol 2,3-dioxygenase-like lactoylglutathione lyase family enzyme